VSNTTNSASVINEKANERHYDGKIYCKTLLYGHRIPSVISFFNDRLPRYIRVLILYISLFTVFFFSGIFYFSFADTNSVNDWGLGHCFGFAIVSTLFDWMLYILFSFLFLFKPFPERQQVYSHEVTSQNVTTSK
jgi:uncharacterized membrane protein